MASGRSSRRRKKDGLFTKLATWFGQGLLVFTPAVGTIYTVYLVLGWLDSLIGLPVPGLGLALTLLMILAVGFVSSHVMGQAMVGAIERAISTLPVVSLLYSSIRDLLGAFVGEKKSFDRPAMVSLDAAGAIKVFGFVTCRQFDDPRLAGMSAVYLPQAYNFAGNVVIVPNERIEYVDADPAQFLAFIVSGGVSAMSGARTVMETMSTTEHPYGSRPSQTRVD